MDGSAGQPSGIVTFLLTDVEGSTEAWETYAGAMDLALRAHDAIVTGAARASGGYVFSTAGDSFAVASSDAGAALTAAVSMQRLLVAEPWPDPVRVRFGWAFIRVGRWSARVTTSVRRSTELPA
jgi:class 3 adenylate cyclase